MGATATSSYLRQLRERQGLTQDKLAKMAGTRGNTIWRIETGRQVPTGPLLMSIVKELRGSPDDIGLLMSDPDATVEDGKRVANERLNSYMHNETAAFADEIGNERVAALLRTLVKDGKFRQQLIELTDAIRDVDIS